MNAPSLTVDQLRSIKTIAHAGRSPRLWLDPDDRDRIRRVVADAHGKAMAERLRLKCDAYLNPDHEHHLNLDAYSNDQLLARPGQHQLSCKMGELAFAGWLWEHDPYLDLARRIMLRRAREAFDTGKTPNDEGKLPDVDYYRSPLGVGITGSPLAWAADLLRESTDAGDWDVLVEHVKKYYLDYGTGDWMTRDRLFSPGFNKTLHGMAAIGELALLIADRLDDDTLNFALSEAIEACLGYARNAMDPHGGTYEGAGYGGSCVGHVIRFAHALKRHGYNELAALPSLRAFGWWMTSLVEPFGGIVPVGDCNGDQTLDASLQILANWYQDPTLQWAYFRGLGRADHPCGPFGDLFGSWKPMLAQQIAFYDPHLDACPPDQAGRGLAYFAKGTDYVSLRSGWGEDDVLVTVIGQGRCNATEAHLGGEAGAIDLTARGKVLLYDPGYGLATAEAHSCMVNSVSPTDAQNRVFEGGGNARFGARVCRFAAGDLAQLTSVDYSQLQDCRWAFRDVVLMQGVVPYVLVGDDMNYRSRWTDYDIFWQVPPGADAAVPGEDRPAMITHDTARLAIYSFTQPPETYNDPPVVQWHDEQFDAPSWCKRGQTQRRLRMRLSSCSGTCLHVLVPGGSGGSGGVNEMLPKIETIPAAAPGLAIRVTFGDQVDTIVFSPYTRRCQTDEVYGFGRLALVRRVRGEVTGHVLIDGDHLRAFGSVRLPQQPAPGQWIAGR